MTKKNIFNRQTISFILSVIVLQSISFAVVSFTSYHLNQQQIFGLMLNNSWAVIISLVILAICLWLVQKQKIKSTIVAFFFAAVISNLLDRVCHGGVIDYINFLGLFWINLADITISLCLVFLGWQTLLNQKNTGA